MKFYEWLMAQRHRSDVVGRYAVLATNDPTFPKRIQRLYLVLRYHAGDTIAQRLAKVAHREWRDVR